MSLRAHFALLSIALVAAGCATPEPEPRRKTDAELIAECQKSYPNIAQTYCLREHVATVRKFEREADEAAATARRASAEYQRTRPSSIMDIKTPYEIQMEQRALAQQQRNAQQPQPVPQTGPSALIHIGNSAGDATGQLAQCVKPNGREPNINLQNRCSFRVYINYCIVDPKKGHYQSHFVCTKGDFGGWHYEPNQTAGNNLSGAQRVYTFVCKAPDTPRDVRFDAERGLVGRCSS